MVKFSLLPGAGAAISEAVPSPPRYYPGWNVVGLSFLLFLLASGPVYYAYGVYAIAFTDAFNTSRTTVNLGYSLLLIVGGIAAALVGWLADRYSLRRIIMMGITGTALGLVLVSLTTAMWQVVALFGSIVACANTFLGAVITSKLIAHWFERRRGFALSLCILGGSAAALIFPPLASALIEHIGWRGAFIVNALIILAVTPFVLMFARLPGAGETDVERRAPSGGTPTAALQPELGYRALLRLADFWVITLSLGLMMGAQGAALVSFIPFAVSKGISTTAAASLMSILGVGALIGKIGFGLLLDRIPLFWALRAGIALIMVSISVLLLADSYGLMATGGVVHGFGMGGMLPVWGALTTKTFGLASAGRALGATRAGMTPFVFTRPLLVGYLFDRTGTYDLAWLALIGILALAMGATFIRGQRADMR